MGVRDAGSFVSYEVPSVPGSLLEESDKLHVQQLVMPVVFIYFPGQATSSGLCLVSSSPCPCTVCLPSTRQSLSLPRQQVQILALTFMSCVTWHKRPGP